MLAYVSAKKKILQFIKTKNLQAGDQLPTELELSEQLDISRLTLREAMNALKSEGLIHSVQGKGTFVACNYDHIADSLNVNYSVSEMIEVAGYKPGVAMFEKKLITADACIAKQLNVQAGTDVLMCSRIRLADDVPVVYSRDYLAPRLAMEFLGVTDETTSLYSFIEDTCGIKLGVCLTELIPTVADEALSKMLSVPAGAPLMKFRVNVNDVFGVPLVYASEYFRPDKFKFVVSRGR